MSKAKIIVLEGLDGSGKSTQIELIKEFYQSKGLKLKHIHFPMYGHNEASAVVSAYLRGEYGDINTVRPQFVGMIYAMDRFFYLPQLLIDLEENDIVLMDRYVFSGMAFQGAKFNLEHDAIRIMNWLYNYEFDFLKLPMYDLSIFIDVPIESIEERLKIRADDENRDYLNGKADIHEADIEFQKRVRDNYLRIYNDEVYFNFTRNMNRHVKCEKMTPAEIFMQYAKLLETVLTYQTR